MACVHYVRKTLCLIKDNKNISLVANIFMVNAPTFKDRLVISSLKIIFFPKQKTFTILRNNQGNKNFHFNVEITS